MEREGRRRDLLGGEIRWVKVEEEDQWHQHFFQLNEETLVAQF